MHNQQNNAKTKEALLKDRDDTTKRYKEHLGAGIGLGIASLGAAAIGAVCPLCVVAVPAMVGSGFYQRYKRSCYDRELAKLEEEGDTHSPLKLEPTQ